MDMANKEPLQLLSGFNRRDQTAFGELYTLYYDELFIFTNNLFRGTEVDSYDIIHDIFMKLWQSEHVVFEDLINIKAYIYVSIKNSFKSYITHKKYVNTHSSELIADSDYLVTQIIESETFSLINQAINILPKDCAEVLRLHLDGWDIKEIATMVGKSERTVYNKKYEAIGILKKKLSKEIFEVLIFLIN